MKLLPNRTLVAVDVERVAPRDPRPAQGPIEVVQLDRAHPNQIGGLRIAYLSEEGHGSLISLARYLELPPVLARVATNHRHEEFIYRYDPAPTAIHATSRGVVLALQRVPLAGTSVLEVGAGEGTLSIVAARLGAARVVGIDLKADILPVARINALRNDVADRVVFRHADFRKDTLELVSPPSVLVMNVPREVYQSVGALLDRLPSVRTFILGGTRQSAFPRDVDLPASLVNDLTERGFQFQTKIADRTDRYAEGDVWNTYVLKR